MTAGTLFGTSAVPLVRFSWALILTLTLLPLGASAQGTDGAESQDEAMTRLSTAIQTRIEAIDSDYAEQLAALRAEFDQQRTDLYESHSSVFERSAAESALNREYQDQLSALQRTTSELKKETYSLQSEASGALIREGTIPEALWTAIGRSPVPGMMIEPISGDGTGSTGSPMAPEGLGADTGAAVDLGGAGGDLREQLSAETSGLASRLRDIGPGESRPALSLDGLYEDYQSASRNFFAAQTAFTQEAERCEAQDFTVSQQRAAGCEHISLQACVNRLVMQCVQSSLTDYARAAYERRDAADRLIEDIEQNRSIPGIIQLLIMDGLTPF